MAEEIIRILPGACKMGFSVWLLFIFWQFPHQISDHNSAPSGLFVIIYVYALKDVDVRLSYVDKTTTLGY